MTKLTEFLEKEKQLMDKATPKYYLSHPKTKHFNNYIIGVDCCEEEPFVLADPNRNMDNWLADAEFIANARSSIPKLLEIIEVMRDEFQSLVESCEWYFDKGLAHERNHFLAVEARGNFLDTALARAEEIFNGKA